MSAPPRIRFVIGGAQKAGTTALATYLATHPAIRLPHDKEAHVFDAPDFNDDAGIDVINARYAGSFESAGAADDATVLHGDATPIYMFHPACVHRIARYNPAMRWIVLLRDPVERAISHWHMEHARGADRMPMFLAMLLEDWRLRGHGDDFSRASPMRTWSYRRRGDYARQLDVVYASFPCDQVLVVRSQALRESPADTLEQVHRFLGVEPTALSGQALRPVFEGHYRAPGAVAPTRILLRLLTRRMRRDLADRHGVAFSGA